MALSTLNRNIKNKGKDIKYLNKDFNDFRNNLIEFSKTYFPKTYSDFNETSPGMMFMEMSSYIGDVLSYYIDDTLKESLLLYAEDRSNIIALSQFLGYKAKPSSPAIVSLSVYQLVPSKINLDPTLSSSDRYEPDSRFYYRIKEGMAVISSTDGITFTTTEPVDFSDEKNREITVFSRDLTTQEPDRYLIKKYVTAMSSELQESTFDFGSYESFRTIELAEDNIVSIYDVRDSNGNKYYEVPYLAQEMVFIEQPNTESNDPDLYQFKDTVPYILKTLKTARRFKTIVNGDLTTTIQFGAADPDASDELLTPNLKNVGLGLPNSISRLDEVYDPTNFLKTKSYGISPSNTTITVKYMTGGGVESNVAAGQLTSINTIEFDEDITSIPSELQGLYNKLKESIATDNERPASGGRGAESVDEIRENALAYFGGQNRAVTAKDYQVRSLSLPPKFGGIAKAYAISDGGLDNNSPASILASTDNLNEFTDLVMSFVNQPDNLEPSRQSVKEDVRRYLTGKTSNPDEKNNPFAINLYTLGFNNQGKLTNLNRGIKENLKKYLNEYRLLTDGVNILDGFIINIAIDFEISAYPSYNKSEVVANCIQELKNYFQIDNWTFNDVINLSEVELLVGNVEGVKSLLKLNVLNKCGDRYSSNSYDILSATKGKNIYPSLDPSVFEVKFPDSDIKGRAI